MAQPYQNSPAQGYGVGYNQQPYYPTQSPYSPRPTYTPGGYPQQNAHAPPVPFQPAPQHALNIGRYEANSQTPSPAQPFPFPPASFPPEMLKHFAGSAIPPPPPLGFPLVPPTNLYNPSVPHFHQSASPAAHYHHYQSQAPGATEDSADAYDPRNPQGILQDFRASSSSRPAAVLPIAQEQDGTLAQTSFTADTSQVQQDIPSVDRRTFPAAVGDCNFATLDPNLQTQADVSREQVAMGNVLQKPEQDAHGLHPIPAPPQGDTSVNASAPNEDTTSLKSQSGIENQVAPAQLREQGKEALLSLTTHNITLDNLAAEGINSDFLKALYTDVGLPQAPVTAKDTETAKGAEVITLKKTEPVKSTIQLATIDSSGLERKDRIAQLLAARAGKASPVQSPSRSAPGFEATAKETVSDGINGQEGRAAQDRPSDRDAAIVGTAEQTHSATQSVETSLLQQQRLEIQTTVPSITPTELRSSTRSRASATRDLFLTGIPGLGMMPAGNESASNVTPVKRALTMDADTPSSDNKRANTGLTTTVQINAGTRSASQDASDGEIVESPAADRQNEPQVQQSQVQHASKPAVPGPIKLTPAQMAEKAEQLKAKFLKQRARQKALQDGIPSLDAEVSRTETLLAQQRSYLETTRQRIDALEADLMKARQEEEVYVRQIQQSEQLLSDGLSGRKRFAEELNSLRNNPTASELKPHAVETATPPQADPVNDESMAEPPQGSSLETSTTTEHVMAAPISHSDKADVSGDAIMNESPRSNNSSEQSSEAMGESSDDSGEVASDDGQFATEDQEVQPGDSMLVDDQIGDENESNDGSASMSDSASDTGEEEGEYSPRDEDATEPMDIDDGSSEEYEPQDSPDGAVELQHNDVIQEMPVDSVQDASDGEEGEIEDTMKPNELAVDDGPDLIEHQGVLADAEHPHTHNSGTAFPVARSSAPATPNGGWGRGKPSVRPLSNEGMARSTSFSAYQSPLSSFPSYRSNPQFDQKSKEGFRSLTYSNNIDPKIPLCPTELSGGTCQDATCEEQHFRHLGLTDDKILVQMSSARDFTDKATRDRFLLGLKDVIADLRARNIKEFEDVARELSKYRCQFVAALS